MNPNGALPVRGVAAALLTACAAFPVSAAAQNVTARTLSAKIPKNGELWIEIPPVFQGWDATFGAGGKTPLSRYFDGPVLSRVYPGATAAAADLDKDAAALGFSPVSASQVSLGTLHVSEVNREIRAVPIRFELGFLDRFSVEVSVPAVWSKAEPFFAFDSSGATVLAGSNALSDNSFFTQLGDARDALSTRLGQGGVPAAQQADARALLNMATAFLDALQRRVLTNDLVPLSSTTVGQQLLAYYAGLQQGFEGYGIVAPSLSLPGMATSADLGGYFGGAFLQGEPLGATVRPWTAGELEAGLRVALLDGFRPDSLAGGLELRTTAGLLFRLPIGNSGSLPYQKPGDFVGVPVGDGQRDVALTLYQDLRAFGLLEVDASATYGLQMSDRLQLRPHPPDRPFPVPDPSPQLIRNLGDYMQLRIAPRLRLDPHVLLGLEYRYWHKAGDRYTLAGGGVDPAVSTLALGSAQTRHRLGLGVTYRPGGTQSGAELGFIWAAAVAGSGPTTPAADLATFHVRIPARVF